METEEFYEFSMDAWYHTIRFEIFSSNVIRYICSDPCYSWIKTFWFGYCCSFPIFVCDISINCQQKWKLHSQRVSACVCVYICLHYIEFIQAHMLKKNVLTKCNQFNKIYWIKFMLIKNTSGIHTYIYLFIRIELSNLMLTKWFHAFSAKNTFPVEHNVHK